MISGSDLEAKPGSVNGMPEPLTRQDCSANYTIYYYYINHVINI
jgi:hypothetical protein